MFTLIFGTYTFPNQSFEVTELPLNRNVNETSVPRMHGSLIQTPYLKSRKIRIKGMLHNDSKDDTQRQWGDMDCCLSQGLQALYIRDDRYINCQTKDIVPDPIEGTDGRLLDIRIDMIAPDPFFYAVGVTPYVSVGPTPGVSYDFDFTNGGNAFGEPDIFVFASGGTITNDIYLKNNTTGEEFSFVGVLPYNHWLWVCGKDLTVYKGANESTKVSGLSDYSGHFITLDPGLNSFTFVGATCALIVANRNRWY